MQMISFLPRSTKRKTFLTSLFVYWACGTAFAIEGLLPTELQGSWYDIENDTMKAIVLEIGKDTMTWYGEDTCTILSPNVSRRKTDSGQKITVQDLKAICAGEGDSWSATGTLFLHLEPKQATLIAVMKHGSNPLDAHSYRKCEEIESTNFTCK